ncbi:protein of unknown function (plasmid) [Cupriavidus taiwanensis]|uniref:Uncharacterized protein n=1 Tax=Cupriavidus taiwanensis TaxID=164546 RepID=A0A375HFS1_9BURK|nr:protein of unknown function [Cupriavidus taiwanensis]SOZ72410.1 protein of unknown function [Cupriavidus taiwanensis]SOZ74777.1 protein of unknown function [Cupriavidus taiwanensis]SPA03612.1 protein of unknown function [Cupriavidus taiwanensis]SPA57417.1 protein of unknown function [Cupriavidus taiwanensis]
MACKNLTQPGVHDFEEVPSRKAMAFSIELVLVTYESTIYGAAMESSASGRIKLTS